VGVQCTQTDTRQFHCPTIVRATLLPVESEATTRSHDSTRSYDFRAPMTCKCNCTGATMYQCPHVYTAVQGGIRLSNQHQFSATSGRIRDTKASPAVHGLGNKRSQATLLQVRMYSEYPALSWQ
jgi:hypothetical protein